MLTWLTMLIQKIEGANLIIAIIGAMWVLYLGFFFVVYNPVLQREAFVFGGYIYAEGGAVVKGSAADGLNGFRNGDTCKLFAALEGILTDSGDLFGDIYAFKLMAI